MAFVEFGDQGSELDTSQRSAPLEVIRKADSPLLFVYIHGWQNNAISGDVCRFEHFIDTVSRYPEITKRKAAQERAIPAHGTWLWRLTLRIVRSAPVS